MPRNRIHDADFDEVSTVDIPANQHGLIVLAKRDDRETAMEYYDADGDPVDINDLEMGEHVFDEDGGEYVIDAADDEGEDEDDVYDAEVEQELVGVGKSAFFQQAQAAGQGLFASLNKSLASAIADEDTRAAIAKAFADQQVALTQANQQAQQAHRIAKAAQDRELEREYIAKAATYNVPVAAEELGPVLKRMAEAMSYDDCAVIAKTLSTSGDLFKSFGVDGDVESDDPFDQVEAYANSGELAKSLGVDGPISKEQAAVAFFDANPDEYAALRRGQR